MNRKLTLASQHKDLQKGDLIAVADSNGTVQVGVFSQVTKRNVLRYISINMDLDKGEYWYKWVNGVYTSGHKPTTYERRFVVEWSRREGAYNTGYMAEHACDRSTIIPYHVDLLTEEQKVNYQKIRQFLRCSDDN